MLKFFRKNKIFRDAVKYTSALPTDTDFAPKNIYLSLSECLVLAGDSVAIGDLVGKKGDGTLVYSGISGRVVSAEKLSDGSFEIVIENDFAKSVSESVLPFGKRNAIKVSDLTPEMLIKEIKEAAITTRGREISEKPRTLCEKVEAAIGKARQIVINCTCADPYDSAADRATLEAPSDIVNGMKILMSALKIGEGFIVLDSEGRARADSLSREIGEGDNIKIVLADVPYPSDNEHLIIYALTSIELSASKNAERIACAVFDWREALAIGRAFVFGERESAENVTVSGDITEPMNAKIPYGTKFSEIIAYCGESAAPQTRIIVGGLLRGREVSEDDVFESSMSPIVILDAESIPSFEGEKCIKCGECARNCPMMLMPMYLYFAGIKGQGRASRLLDADACIECGACQYVCPSEIPILSSIRHLKKQGNGGGDDK